MKADNPTPTVKRNGTGALAWLHPDDELCYVDFIITGVQHHADFFLFSYAVGFIIDIQPICFTGIQENQTDAIQII